MNEESADVFRSIEVYLCPENKNRTNNLSVAFVATEKENEKYRTEQITAPAFSFVLWKTENYTVFRSFRNCSPQHTNASSLHFRALKKRNGSQQNATLALFEPQFMAITRKIITNELTERSHIIRRTFVSSVARHFSLFFFLSPSSPFSAKDRGTEKKVESQMRRRNRSPSGL